MITSFAEAVRNFEEVQEEYAEFGACDTEPSVEFAVLVRQLINGKEPEVPTTADGWQLFSDMKGVGKATRALTATARKAVTAGKRDHLGLVRYAKHELWRA